MDRKEKINELKAQNQSEIQKSMEKILIFRTEHKKRIHTIDKEKINVIE